MKSAPTPAEMQGLFANTDAGEVWAKAAHIVGDIDPAYDLGPAKAAFDDVVRLFRGEYPGYAPIKTLYHDMSHTLSVFLCAVRLMHGVHISGTRLADSEMTMIMLAALMHDVGYVQRRGEETGTGAQYTQNHVGRGVAFMRRYIAEHRFPPDLAAPLRSIILCTDPVLAIDEIDFPDERAHLLGQIVRTADLTGQMADRTYLEKLLLLYFEFKEARLGGYRNTYDLLCKTQKFYEITRQKLDGELGGIYTRLSFHFQDWFGVENNYYLESIEKNIAYLSKVTSLARENHLSMLKRGGIAEKTQKLAAPNDLA